ncbi:MAG: Uma2 family endonuclease, partial [Gammaproteobacteria bacterium]|nr:Uma2 family endonuclease [Gammaproteobacteria bacterium]
FVAFGVRPGPRDLYKIWEEQPPAFVLEITSKTTRLEDERTKRDRYAEWGVREYFLYDPRAEWLDPPLQGLALDGKRYRSMHPSTLPNGKRGFRSKTLGLCPWLSDAVLRLFDPATGQDLPTPEAEAAARAAAESRAEAAESSALVHQRTLVVRLAKRRFDPATAASLAALIECVDSWDDIARIGEWVVSSVGPAELLARVRVAFPR